jgi:DNA-binding HxlR family transcriptional regulator
MKGKKTEFASSPCPIARTLGIIGDWWSLLIIRDALEGPQRFGELQRNLGLAKNILATRLRKLVDAGILTTAPVAEGSAFSEYRLSEKGEQLYLVLAALWQWGEKFVAVPAQGSLRVVDRKKLQPVAIMELRSQDGRRLGPRDVTARVLEAGVPLPRIQADPLAPPGEAVKQPTPPAF